MKNIRAPLRLSLEHDEDDGLSPLLFEIVQLVVLQQALDHKPLPNVYKWDSLFRVESVEVGQFFFHSENYFQYLHRIASCGIRVDKLLLYDMDVTTAAAPRYAFTLQQFLAANDATASSGFPASSTIEVLHHETSGTYDAIFSALLHSRSVREFILMSPNESFGAGSPARTPTRDRLWQWIAAAVFSSQATNPIDSVFFDGGSLTMEDATALEDALLQTQDPMAVLFPGYGKKTNVSSVTASMFRLTEDEHDEDPDLVVTSETAIECRCILDDGEDSEWLSVVLPGCGQAWVERSEAIVVGASSTAKVGEVARVRNIKRLEIDDPITHAEGVVKGLRVIGSGIEQLVVTNLYAISGPSTSEWLASVLEACPRLDVFDIRHDRIQFVKRRMQ